MDNLEPAVVKHPEEQELKELDGIPIIDPDDFPKVDDGLAIGKDPCKDCKTEYNAYGECYCYDCEKEHNYIIRVEAAKAQKALDDNRTKKEKRELVNILKDLVDSDDCVLDHHGYCQSHGWLNNSECPHARAKKTLEELK